MDKYFKYEYKGIENYFELNEETLGFNNVYRVTSKWAELDMYYIFNIKDFSYNKVMEVINKDIEAYEEYNNDGKDTVTIRGRVLRKVR